LNDKRYLENSHQELLSSIRRKKRSRVGISQSNYSHICDNLGKALDCFGFSLKGKKDVVIKINLSDFRPPETGVITHPLFLNALLKYLRTSFNPNRIFVVESDSVVGLPDYFIKWFGFLPILEKWNAEYVNLSRCKSVRKKIDGSYLKSVHIPKVFIDNPFFISLAKLKTSNITKITCILKNQFGCLPGRWKSKYHPVIDDVIADVNLAFKPHFSIVDGIIGLGGVQGPSFGIPIRANIFIYGEDPVAVDSVCAKIMGFKPSSIPHITKSAKMGIGSMRFEIMGKKVENDFCFKRLDFYLLRIGSWLQNRASK